MLPDGTRSLLAPPGWSAARAMTRFWWLAFGAWLGSNQAMTNPTQNNSSDMAALLEIMRRLRDPETGCPWDRVQDFGSIAPYTVEEAYEVAGAIEDGDFGGLKDELGDLLFQVVFHSQIASERGLFGFSDVVSAVCMKMLRRHPHVFAEAGGIENAEAQVVAWEEHKRRERALKPELRLLDDVPRALPALLRAVKLQKRAATVGFDWDSVPKVVEKIIEEAGEIAAAQAAGEGAERVAEEFGDLLFAVANLARHLKVEPEAALRAANGKFVRRFRFIERELEAAGRGLEGASLEEMEGLWLAAKGAGL